MVLLFSYRKTLQGECIIKLSNNSTQENIRDY